MTDLKLNRHLTKCYKGGVICELTFTFAICLLTAFIPNDVLAQQYKVVIPYGTVFCEDSEPTDPSKPDEGYFDEGTTVYFRVSNSDLKNVIMNDENILDFFSPAGWYRFNTDLQCPVYKFVVGNSDCTIDSYYPVTFNDDKAQEGRDPITWYLGDRTKYVRNNTIIPENYIINPSISVDWSPMKFQLEGWYTTATYDEGTKWDFTKDKVTGVVNLYPKWTPHKYKIVAEPSEVIQLKSSTNRNELNKNMIKTYIVNLTEKDTIRPGFDLCAETSDNVYWNMLQLANGKPYHTNVVYSTDGDDGWVKLRSTEYICDPEEVEVKVKVTTVDSKILGGAQLSSTDNVYHKLPKIDLNIPETNPVESYPIKFVVNGWYNYFPKEGSTSFTYQFTKGVDECTKGENTISVLVPYYDDQNGNCRYFYQTIDEFTFDIEPYKVTFGNTDKSFDVEAYEDELITKPEDPHKDGYTFDGWYTPKGKKWDFAQDEVDGDMTLSPKWTINTHKLTYKIDNEVYGEVETVEYGAPLTLRANPIKEGYTFSGWSGLPETMPDEDVTVTGSWTENPKKENPPQAPQKIIPSLSDTDKHISFPKDWKQFCKKQETAAILSYTITNSAEPTSCIITIETIEGSHEYPAKNGKVEISTLPEFPGEYACSAVFTGDEELTTPSDTINFTLDITAAHGLILRLYKNVIFVNNHSKKFETYQWYRYGEETDEKLNNGARQYFTEPTLKGSYWALLNGKIHACPWTSPSTAKIAASAVKTYPNPAISGQPFRLEVLEFNPDTEYTMIISNSNGNIVKTLTVTDPQTTLSLPQGIYTGALISSGEKQSFKLIVR